MSLLYTNPRPNENNLGHMNIRGPQLFYSFFHTLDESSSYWRTICGLELCFVVFVFNNDNYRARSWRSDAINYCIAYCQIADLKLFTENSISLLRNTKS